MLALFWIILFLLATCFFLLLMSWVLSSSLSGEPGRHLP
jgi:hypothetical protein